MQPVRRFQAAATATLNDKKSPDGLQSAGAIKLNDTTKVKVLSSPFNSGHKYAPDVEVVTCTYAPAPGSNVRLPLEYNGEQLDKTGLPVLIQGQYFDLEQKPLARVYELIQHFDTLDVGEYQLELIAPDFTDEKGKEESVGKMAVYLRSRRLGEIIVKPKRATFRTDRNDPPSMTTVNYFLQTLRGWIALELTEDAFERLAAPKEQLCIGVEGVRALLNLDKLNLKFSEGILPRLTWNDGHAKEGAYFFELLKKGGIGYQRKAVVRYEGRQIGIILWEAAFPGLEETARFEVENGELYSTLNDGTLREIIEGLASNLKAEIIAVFRVDIAIDGPGVMTFLERVHNREIMLVRQSSYHTAKKIVGLATDQIEGFGAGSRASGRYFRCYVKTKELRDGRRKKGPTYKQHIDGDHWILNGLKPGQEIGRLEVELLNRYLKTVEGFTWEDVFDREKMVGLFSTAMDKVFEWVPTHHNDSKINRRPRVEIVDFSAVKTDPYQRSFPVPCKSDRMEKITTKRLFVEAAFVTEECESVSLFQAAEDMVDRHNLHAWLAEKSDSILQTVGEVMVDRNELPIDSWSGRFHGAVDYAKARVRNDQAMLTETLRLTVNVITAQAA